ncbi:MAG: hypothetical protein RR235_05020 [Oscillospiraceae bacterium]
MSLKFRTEDSGVERIGCGSLKVLRRLNPHEFAVELRIMRDGENINAWDFRNIEDCWQTFVGRPILCAYVAEKIGDGHNMRERTDPETGERYYSFMDGVAERIVGALSDDPKDFSLEKDKEGHTWIVGKGRLWEFYAPELVRKIVRAGRMDISAETHALEKTDNGQVTVFTKWEGLGVTVLGDDVSPAIPGADIKALQALGCEFKTMKLRAAALESNEAIPRARTKKETKQIPNKGVEKQSMNKTFLAELQKKFKGYTVLSASEDGMNVCLLSDAGLPCTYAFTSREDASAVVAERIAIAPVCASFNFGETSQINVDVADITDTLMARLTTLSASFNEAVDARDKAEAALDTMRKAENQRRVSFAKTAVQGLLKDFNANRKSGSRIGDEVLTGIVSAIDAGEYTGLEDTAGKWIGDVRACEALSAKCMEEISRMDKLAAEKQKAVYPWSTAKKNTGASTSIGELFSKIVD